jgi:Fe-S cluster biosynthesis and repair protein YggX
VYATAPIRLERAPYPGARRAHSRVGEQARLGQWLAHQTMLINENRLSPVDPQARQFLQLELKKYLLGPVRKAGLPE